MVGEKSTTEGLAAASLRLSELASLLAPGDVELMEVYDGDDTGSPVCTGGCDVFGDRVVGRIVPDVCYDGVSHRAMAYLSVRLRGEGEAGR